MNVVSFGQLPGKVIYREIQEQQGITLRDYIENRYNEWLKQDTLYSHGMHDEQMTFRGDGVQNNIAKIDEDSREEHVMTKSDKKMRTQGQHEANSFLSRDKSKQSSGTTSKRKNISSSQETLFSEFEAIDIGIKIIDLLELLHS